MSKKDPTKKDLSESDICDRYITPALHKAGWKKSQIRREYSFTDGQVIVRGETPEWERRKRADYVLFHHTNQVIAVIEAKDNSHSVEAGIQQAQGYANKEAIVEIIREFGSDNRYTTAPQELKRRFITISVCRTPVLL